MVLNTLGNPSHGFEHFNCSTLHMQHYKEYFVRSFFGDFVTPGTLLYIGEGAYEAITHLPASIVDRNTYL